MKAPSNSVMADTVKVACSTVVNGYYIQDRDKVPKDAKIFKEKTVRKKPLVVPSERTNGCDK